MRRVQRLVKKVQKGAKAGEKDVKAGQKATLHPSHLLHPFAHFAPTSHLVKLSLPDIF